MEWSGSQPNFLSFLIKLTSLPVQTSFLDQLICIHGNPHNGNGIEETQQPSIYFPGNIQKYFSSQVACDKKKLSCKISLTETLLQVYLFCHLSIRVLQKHCSCWMSCDRNIVMCNNIVFVRCHVLEYYSFSFHMPGYCFVRCHATGLLIFFIMWHES